MHNHHNQLDAETRRRNRILLIGWLSFALSVVIFLAGTIWHHSQGEGWFEATGLQPSKELFQIIGDFGVPLIVLVLMMQQVNRLPPSREKTVLKRTGWAFFVYLFVWWVGLHPTLFTAW